MFAFMLGICFLLLRIASAPDDPLTRPLFLQYNEHLKKLGRKDEKSTVPECTKA